jgi:histidinol phosphatase-like enzyme
MKVYWIKDADSRPAKCTALQLLTYMYVVAKNEDGILTGYLKRNHIAAMNTADDLFAEITAMDRRGEVVS